MTGKFTSENFDAEVLRAEKPVLVDFYADWCGPCKMMAPVVDAVAEEFGSMLTVGKLNVDESSDVAERYGVMTIPTLILFKNGKEVSRMSGLQPKETLRSFLKAGM